MYLFCFVFFLVIFAEQRNGMWNVYMWNLHCLLWKESIKQIFLINLFPDWFVTHPRMNWSPLLFSIRLLLLGARVCSTKLQLSSGSPHCHKKPQICLCLGMEPTTTLRRGSRANQCAAVPPRSHIQYRVSTLRSPKILLQSLYYMLSVFLEGVRLR